MDQRRSRLTSAFSRTKSPSRVLTASQNNSLTPELTAFEVVDTWSGYFRNFLVSSSPAATWTVQRGRWRGPARRPPLHSRNEPSGSLRRGGCSLEHVKRVASAVGEGAISISL